MENETEGSVVRTCTCQKGRCGRTWTTRLPFPKVPAQCPYCKRYDWQIPDSTLAKLHCVCTHCKREWDSDLPNGPRYCPGCKTPFWRDPKTRIDNICQVCTYLRDDKCLRRWRKPVANKCKGFDPKRNPMPVLGDPICDSCWAYVKGKCSRTILKPIDNKCRLYIGGLPPEESGVPADF